MDHWTEVNNPCIQQKIIAKCIWWHDGILSQPLSLSLSLSFEFCLILPFNIRLPTLCIYCACVCLYALGFCLSRLFESELCSIHTWLITANYEWITNCVIFLVYVPIHECLLTIIVCGSIQNDSTDWLALNQIDIFLFCYYFLFASLSLPNSQLRIILAKSIACNALHIL